MSYFDKYKDRVTDSFDFTGVLSQNTQDFIDLTFSKSPTYKEIIYNGSPLGVRLMTQFSEEGSSKLGNDYRKVVFQNINFMPYVGDICEFDNEVWVVIEVDWITTKSAVIQRCNYILKWIDVNSEIIEQPALTKNATMYSLGSKERRIIEVPDGKLNVILPYNSDSNKITRSQRFIYHKFAYEVTFIDYSLVDEDKNIGLISFILTESGIDEVNDNLELRIANYYKYFEDTTEEENTITSTVSSTNTIESDITEQDNTENNTTETKPKKQLL